MKAYGCGRGRIYREVQPEYKPSKKKPEKKPKVASATSVRGVVVTDLETGEVHEFERVSQAAAFLCCDPKRINDRLSKRIISPWHGRYEFSRPGKAS